MGNPITAEVVYELTSVSSPSLSPGGGLLVYAQSKVERETMETKSRLMLISLPGGAPSGFTQGPGDSAPGFSPDGELIAFLRRDEKKRPQIWVIPAHGGEARQVTSAGGGVMEFGWGPASDALVFVADVWPEGEGADSQGGNSPRVKVVRRIGYRADTLGWRGDAYRHLFTVGVEGGEAKQITNGDYDHSGPKWSPDGSRIAFISARRDDRELTPFNEAYVTRAEGGEVEMQSQGLSSVGALSWDPEGRRLVAIASDDEAIGAAWQGWLFLLEKGSAPVRLTDDSIKPAAGFPPTSPAPEVRWTKDGRILFLGDAQGESYLCELGIEGGTVRRVGGGGGQFSGVTLDGKAAVAVVQVATPASPGELRLMEVGTGAQPVLVSPNGEYLASHPPASLEKWTTERKGWQIESRLLKPPDFDPGKTYPLVLDIHGGPHGAFYDAFNAVQQVMATAGYLVLCVNPRGSSTYGAEFLRAVIGDWGGEDYLDIMCAVEEVSGRPYVDASRLGVHGYSYGGFMSSWIIGHDVRFGAAVVGAPCADLPSMCGTSDIGVSFGERQWAGTRHDALDSMVQHSPLTFAEKVQTPVLLLHGEADHRCPIEQSEQYFVTLKRLGKEVEFVRFPGCSHLFMRAGHPKMREEYLARTLGWFERYLGGGGR